MGKLALCDVRGLLNQLNDVLSGEDDRVWFEALKKFLRKENPWPVESFSPVSDSIKSNRWREVDGVIYLTVTLDEWTTGEEWITRMDKKGNLVENYAKSVLLSEKFKSSAAGTYEIVILKCSFFEESDYTFQNIHAKATEMKLTTPNADIACLIREQFTDEEIKAMGLWWIIVMHKPINDSYGTSSLLAVNRGSGCGRLLATIGSSTEGKWGRFVGFAFFARRSVPQP